MRRFHKSNIRFVFLFAFLAVVCPLTAVQATTFLLSAQPSNEGVLQGVGAFSLQYVDEDGDGLLSNAELSSVTNFTPLFYLYAPSGYLYGPITAVPVYAVGYSEVTNGDDNWFWWTIQWGGAYGEGPATNFIDSLWTYTHAEVPIPPSAFLLGAGLIPLAWARRKKRSGK